MRNQTLLAGLTMVAVLVAAQPSMAGRHGRAVCSPCCSVVDVCWSVPCGSIPPYIIIPEPPVNGGRIIPEPPVNGQRIIPGPPVEEVISDDPLTMGQGHRTWVYGESPKLVIGTLQGMESGQVRIVKRQGGVATIPMEQLSSIDQKIVATQLATGSRTWTDRSRRYQRTAEFVRVAGRSVVLKTDTGKAIYVAFAKLSPADQCVVRNLSGAPIVEEWVTPPAAVLASR